MKVPKFFQMVMAGACTLIAVRGAEPDFRTNINPALLYFQAYQLAPRLSEADSKYLFDAWSSETLDARRVNLLNEYDNAFKLLRRARFAAVPCDWGYDLSDGPEALLPGLAPAKGLAQAARLRATAALEAGHFDTARDDLAAAYTLSRQLAADHILISALVQYAAENILMDAVAENYYRLSADQLDQLVAGFDSAPRQGTIAETVLSTERDAFFQSIHAKLARIAAEAKGNERAFWGQFAEYWNHIASDSDSNQAPNATTDEVKEAAGGTAAGMLRLMDQMPAFYEEIGRVLALPYTEYATKAPALFTKISTSPNPFVRTFLTAFKNVRPKEFSATVRLEMVRAAAAYKRNGIDGLRRVRDPFGSEQFELTRVQVDGSDRGFALKCPEPIRDFPEKLIFIEKPGAPLHLEGPHAGTPR